MTYAIAASDLLSSAAGDLAGMGSAISGATASATAALREMLPAAADEVSVQIAALFAGSAEEFRAVSSQAAAFHDTFVRALQGAALSYANTEAANARTAATSFIMGGTFNPQPNPNYVTLINNLFIQTNPAYTGYTPFGLYTPETVGLPFIGGMTVNQAVAQGQLILNNALMNLPAGSKTLVFGNSQSAMIATLEMRALGALPAELRPSPSDLSFMLIGNGDTPNGGLLTRFNLNLPILGVTTAGPTPPDTPYPTTIYSLQYDGFANFPQYPLNIFADLNAIAGIALVHSDYAFLTPADLQTAVPLATSPGYYENGGVTHYYMIPKQDLPLLAPLRAIPIVGQPLAELLQPDLRVLVNLGYNPNGYADIPTSAQLWPGFEPLNILLGLVPPPYNGLLWTPYTPSPPPNFDPLAIAGQLVLGAQQGVTNALVVAGALPTSSYATTYPAINDLSYMTAVA